MKRSYFLDLCLIALAAVLTLAPSTDARAYGYGYGHGYGYYGHGYGHGYGYGYYGHGYGHGYGYGYDGYYGHGYGHGGYSYGYSPGYSYGYQDDDYDHGLVYGLLSLPGRIVGGLFGYPDDHSHRSSNGGQNAVTNDSTRDTFSSPTSVTSNTAYGSGGMDMNGRGWALLAEGHDTSALSYFATAAESHPQNGIPKVGYALSSAGTGDLVRGVWAMRRAARIDPEGMRYVHLGAKHAVRIHYLIDQYQSRVEGYHHADDAFMVAALKYLIGDLRGAHTSLALATQYGDNSRSTRSLTLLVDDPSTTSSNATVSGKSGY